MRAIVASLVNAIYSFLISKDIDINKVAYIGFDGCNSMNGEIKGTLNML
jgi:hypothetical protein